MTTILIALYIACAVATYGWAINLVYYPPKQPDWFDKITATGVAATWPLMVPLTLVVRTYYGVSLWRGWRIR